MDTLTKTKTLENDLRYICDQCHYQFLIHGRVDQSKALANSVKEIKSLRERNLVGEEAYNDLLKFAISIYIANEVSSKLEGSLNRALREKLSPHNILEALA